MKPEKGWETIQTISLDFRGQLLIFPKTFNWWSFSKPNLCTNKAKKAVKEPKTLKILYSKNQILSKTPCRTPVVRHSSAINFPCVCGRVEVTATWEHQPNVPCLLSRLHVPSQGGVQSRTHSEENIYQDITLFFKQDFGRYHLKFNIQIKSDVKSC